MGTIIVDGKVYSGDNLTVIDGKVIIDGKECEGTEKGNINILVNGNINKLNCTKVNINGDVLGNVDATTVNCKAIGGNVDATTVKCDYIEGKVDAVTIKTKKK